MNFNKHNFPSTDKIPYFYDKNYNRYKKKLSNHYTNMFFDDFCSSFHIHLCNNTNSMYDFFSFTGDKNKFMKIFGYDFLSHDFDEIISNVAQNMLLYGKAYVVKEVTYNKKHKIKQIDYRCINCKKIKMRGNHLYYKFVNSLNGQTEQGKISMDNCLTFDIKNANLKGKHILKKIKKIDKNSSTKNMHYNYKYFDFHHFKRKEEQKQLLLTKNIYWSCRNNDNYYLSEPYLLFRKINFSLLQEKLLNYIVSIFNKDLVNIKLKGKIIYNSKVKDYDKLLDDLNSGEKNCKEVCDTLFKYV